MEIIQEINEALLYIFNNIFLKTDAVNYTVVLEKCNLILNHLDHIDHRGNTHVVRDYVMSIKQLVDSEQSNLALTDIVYALSELVYIRDNKPRTIRI